LASGRSAPNATLPEVPNLLIASAIDEIVTPAERTRPAHEAAPTPSWYPEIAETGHNAFSKFCTSGGGTGIIGLAGASGLGPVLEATPNCEVDEDGCVPPAAPVDLTFTLVRHDTASFPRWHSRSTPSRSASTPTPSSPSSCKNCRTALTGTGTGTGTGEDEQRC
jgi:hypothetical protein